MQLKVPINDDEKISNGIRPKTRADEIVEHILDLQRQIRELERELHYVQINSGVLLPSQNAE